MPEKERWYFTKEELENSPSRKCGIDADKELSQRQQAANFIQDMGQRLQVTQLCINTAIVYMHRFYCFHSFTHFHRNAIASAALFLAAKVEEQPRKLEHIIKVAQLCLQKSQSAAAAAAAAANPDRRSELYAEQAQELVSNENVLLMTLGFDVAIEHPHAFIVKFCHIANASKDLSQTSYFMASNSLHLTTMCLQYKPTVVACFCIHLVCKWSNWQIPKSKENLPWYSYIDPTVTEELLEQLTNEFLVIFDKCPSRLKKKIQNSQLSTQNSSMSSYPFDVDGRKQMPPQQLLNNDPSPMASTQSSQQKSYEAQNPPSSTSKNMGPSEDKKSTTITTNHHSVPLSSSTFHSSSKSVSSSISASVPPPSSSLPNVNGNGSSDHHHSCTVSKLLNSAMVNANSRSSTSVHSSSNLNTASSSSSHQLNSFDSSHQSTNHKNIAPGLPSAHAKPRPAPVSNHTAPGKDPSSIHRSESRSKADVKPELNHNSLQHQQSSHHPHHNQQHYHHHHYPHSSQPHQSHQPQQQPPPPPQQQQLHASGSSQLLTSSSSLNHNHYSKSGHRKDNGSHHHHHHHHQESNGRDFVSTSHSDIISNVVKEVAKQHEKQTVKVEPLADDEKVVLPHSLSSNPVATPPPVTVTVVHQLSTTPQQQQQQQPQPQPSTLSQPQQQQQQQPQLLHHHHHQQQQQTSSQQPALAVPPEVHKGHSIFSPPPVSSSGSQSDIAKEKRHHHKEKKRHKEKRRHKEDKHHKHRHKERGSAEKDLLKEPGPIRITIPKEKLVDIPMKLKIKINKDQIVTPASTSEESFAEPSADIKLKISKDKLKSRKRNRDSDHEDSNKKFVYDTSGSLNGHRDYRTG